VLKHHALGSKVLWSDVVADYRGPRTLNPITLNGDALNLFVNAPNRPNPTTPFPIDFVPSQVKIWGSGENVNEAGQIITIDLVAKNGVIHYVNEVLIPNAVVGAR
jgi:hypothetical protein